MSIIEQRFKYHIKHFISDLLRLLVIHNIEDISNEIRDTKIEIESIKSLNIKIYDMAKKSKVPEEEIEKIQEKSSNLLFYLSEKLLLNKDLLLSKKEINRSVKRLRLLLTLILLLLFCVIFFGSETLFTRALGSIIFWIETGVVLELKGKLIFQYFSELVENNLQKIAPESWNKTSDCFLDTIEAFPDEIKRWDDRNLKYVAYLVFTWDLLGFFCYFTKTLISNAIATKRVSS